MPLHTLDLGFYDTEGLIASFLAATDGGFALFDPGPASCVAALERQVRDAGYELEQLGAVFATHVHLDHAGGAGVLARRTGCTVYCHPEGAPHLIEPEAKLLPSAERLYGDMMEPLWGRTEGVPDHLVRAVADGTRVTIDGLEVVGWHTPGHAVHHVAWQVGSSIATGDVAGVRFQGATHVLPPMPPPDIDVESWRRSLDRLRELEPQRLSLTHFGSFSDPQRHLDELEARLLRWTEIAERVVEEGGDTAELGSALERLDDVEMNESRVSPEAVERYRRLCPMRENSAGLLRYCATRRR
jgi:glyoxylase-like metal-dependent hydrolase (beta-lactamase superfamily II)